MYKDLTIHYAFLTEKINKNYLISCCKKTENQQQTKQIFVFKESVTDFIRCTNIILQWSHFRRDSHFYLISKDFLSNDF